MTSYNVNRVIIDKSIRGLDSIPMDESVGKYIESTVATLLVISELIILVQR